MARAHAEGLASRIAAQPFVRARGQGVLIADQREVDVGALHVVEPGSGADCSNPAVD
ncbi:MAG: hypothetical protein ACRBN8_02140 [Nannocystales bacterium]